MPISYEEECRILHKSHQEFDMVLFGTPWSWRGRHAMARSCISLAKQPICTLTIDLTSPNAPAITQKSQETSPKNKVSSRKLPKMAEISRMKWVLTFPRPRPRPRSPSQPPILSPIHPIYHGDVDVDVDVDMDNVSHSPSPPILSPPHYPQIRVRIQRSLLPTWVWTVERVDYHDWRRLIFRRTQILMETYQGTRNEGLGMEDLQEIAKIKDEESEESDWTSTSTLSSLSGSTGSTSSIVHSSPLPVELDWIPATSGDLDLSERSPESSPRDLIDLEENKSPKNNDDMENEVLGQPQMNQVKVNKNAVIEEMPPATHSDDLEEPLFGPLKRRAPDLRGVDLTVTSTLQRPALFSNTSISNGPHTLFEAASGFCHSFLQGSTRPTSIQNPTKKSDQGQRQSNSGQVRGNYQAQRQPQGQPCQHQGQPHQYQGQPRQNQGQPHQNQSQPHQHQGQPHQHQGQLHQHQGQPHQHQSQPRQNQSQLHQHQGQPRQNQGQPDLEKPSCSWGHPQPQLNPHPVEAEKPSRSRRRLDRFAPENPGRSPSPTSTSNSKSKTRSRSKSRSRSTSPNDTEIRALLAAQAEAAAAAAKRAELKAKAKAVAEKKARIRRERLRQIRARYRNKRGDRLRAELENQTQFYREWFWSGVRVDLQWEDLESYRIPARTATDSSSFSLEQGQCQGHGVSFNPMDEPQPDKAHYTSSSVDLGSSPPSKGHRPHPRLDPEARRLWRELVAAKRTTSDPPGIQTLSSSSPSSSTGTIPAAGSMSRSPSLCSTPTPPPSDSEDCVVEEVLEHVDDDVEENDDENGLESDDGENGAGQQVVVVEVDNDSEVDLDILIIDVDINSVIKMPSPYSPLRRECELVSEDKVDRAG